MTNLTVLRQGGAALIAVLLTGAAAAAATDAGTAFADCTECPEMVVLPAGTFTRGSPEAEPGRSPNEGPRAAVTHARPFALARHEVTRAQFSAFVAATDYRPHGPCMVLSGGDWQEQAKNGWRDPGFAQSDRHPVACVNWDDAAAYADWLARRTGRPYRLPTAAEWEYASRAGGSAARPWGARPEGACAHANVYDATGESELRIEGPVHGCRDGFVFTAPVGSFRANAFGLHDMIGNVFEWVADCATGSYRGAPVDGSAVEMTGCDERDVRGGCWYSGPSFARAAFRFGFPRSFRGSGVGFRVALDLVP